MSVNFKKLTRLPGCSVYRGEGAFVGAAVTATIDLPFGVECDAIAGYGGTVPPAVADGPLSTTVSGKVLTVTRVAGTTAGATFKYIAFGY